MAQGAAQACSLKFATIKVRLIILYARYNSRSTIRLPCSTVSVKTMEGGFVLFYPQLADAPSGHFLDLRMRYLIMARHGGVAQRQSKRLITVESAVRVRPPLGWFLPPALPCHSAGSVRGGPCAMPPVSQCAPQAAWPCNESPPRMTTPAPSSGLAPGGASSPECPPIVFGPPPFKVIGVTAIVAAVSAAVQDVNPKHSAELRGRDSNPQPTG